MNSIYRNDIIELEKMVFDVENSNHSRKKELCELLLTEIQTIKSIQLQPSRENIRPYMSGRVREAKLKKYKKTKEFIYRFWKIYYKLPRI